MVGFSAFVSIGSMLDVGWGDLISYFGDDPNTKSIVLYMETIGDARAFLSAAREVALTFDLYGSGRAGRVRNSGKFGCEVVTYRVTAGKKELISTDDYPAMNRIVEHR